MWARRAFEQLTLLPGENDTSIPVVNCSVKFIFLLEMSDVQMTDFGHLDLYCIFLCIPRGHSISLRGSYHLRLSLVELCQKGTMTKVVT